MTTKKSLAGLKLVGTDVVMAGCRLIRQHKHRMLLECKCGQQFIHEAEEVETANAGGKKIACLKCRHPRQFYSSPPPGSASYIAVKELEKGLSYKEVAKIAGVATQTVDKLYWRYIIGCHAFVMEEEAMDLLIRVDELEITIEELQAENARLRSEYSIIKSAQG
jgi:hypothetical protein